MALIDITPVMTSNTTPSPYVASASTFYNQESWREEPWRVFDNSLVVESGWVTSLSNTQGWIQLDFGIKTKVSAISIASRGLVGLTGSSPQVGTTEAPKNFKIYASNDGLSYDLITSLDNEVLWRPEETRLYKFSTDVTYRYYKLIISANNGYALYLAIGEIKFYQSDESEPSKVNSTYQTQRRTLPHGTKLRLDNLTSDLPYMLATESDGENEGTLRMVNHAGKFIIPKARIKYETIFDGVASVARSTYTLSKNLKNYTSVMIVACLYSTTTNRNSMCEHRLVEDILGGRTNNDIAFACSPASADFRYIMLSFKDDGNSFIVHDVGGSGGTQAITKIYGVY